MKSNQYFDTKIQKAFMPSVPGCVEHYTKLAAAVSEARTKHKLLCVCWLDLANAYGSVHHDLIDFSLKYYHAPPPPQAHQHGLEFLHRSESLSERPCREDQSNSTTDWFVPR